MWRSHAGHLDPDLEMRAIDAATDGLDFGSIIHARECFQKLDYYMDVTKGEAIFT